VEEKTINALASAIGLALLVGLVSGAAYLYSPGRHFWVTAIAGNLFTVPFAIAIWKGMIWKDRAGDAPITWQHWISVFFGGLLLSVVCIAIDVAIVHPGFSLLFTIGAISLTFIALPSALRQWVRERLSVRREGRE
jgi:hypothetical protein